jgi:hypothetical protein
MTPEHKEKLRVAREAAIARKLAVDAEIDSPDSLRSAFTSEIDPRDAELETLRSRVAHFEATRERAAHEHETITGRERVGDPGVIPGAQADVQTELRRLLREELAQVLPERQPGRTNARDAVRANAVVAHDRDGNPIYRKRDSISDEFSIPDDLREPGWDYQWIRTSVHGQEDVSNQVNMQENGWRFVPASRKGWDGRFMPKGYQGAIFKSGLSLMERPAVLTEEARKEAGMRVREQSQAQRQQFGLALPDGFTSQHDGARAFTFARQGRAEATPDALRPAHQVAGSDIDR